MITWGRFLESLVTTRHNVDSSQIESIYNKAHIAVELVKMYRPELFNQIAVVANLASGAYGIYNSGEDNEEKGDTVHVNVRRIMNEKRTDVEAILEIASTIVHEATHDDEYAAKGQSDEMGPKKAEDQFLAWARQNWQVIIQKFPEINQPSPYFQAKQRSALPSG